MRQTDEDNCSSEKAGTTPPGCAPSPGRRLIRLRSGVAASTARRVQGNVLAEWWTLFVSHDQVEASLALDPLRFEDPLLFAKLQRKLHHALLHATTHLDA